MTQVTVRVILKSCHTDCNYCLAVRNGIVVVSPLDRNDANQYWIKEMKYELQKDAEGFPAFVLINKGTGEALRHYGGGDDFTQPCKLVAYDPIELWPSTLFTEGNDINDGFRNIRLQNFIDWHFYVKWNETIDGSEVRQGQKNVVKSALWKMEIQLDSPIPTKTYRVRCLDGLYSLGVRDGLPVMLPNNPKDNNQKWIQDTRYNIKVNKDGTPTFALINKATNEALRDIILVDQKNLLVLSKNNQNVLDESAAWTLNTATSGSGFSNISSFNYNTKLTVNRGGKEDIDGLPVILGNSSYGNGTSWKIVKHETFRIFAKINQYCSVTIRNGIVVLANSKQNDLNQHWFKDERHGMKWKDIEGKPAFALVNIGTGQAIRHSAHNEPVGLTYYDPDKVDISYLWSETIGSDGFRFIRRIDNMDLLFDAEFGGDYVKDGTRLLIFEHENLELAANANNLKWNMLPYNN